MRAVLWLITVASLGAALFFWSQSADLQARLDGLSAETIAHDEAVAADLARLKTFDEGLDGLDRAFARGLNGQDAMTKALARLTTPPEQSFIRADLEARLAKLRDDIEPSAKLIRDALLKQSPPDYTLDPDKISADANADFLAAIDGDPTFTKTPTGLRYKALKTNPAGVQPTSASEVTVQYKGSFIEGTEFDSSYKTGEPATFMLDKLIPGWTEGIALMHEGETFRFVIPYDLAYGVAGRGPLPGRQTLVFDVELLKVLSAPAVAAPPP